MRRVVVLGRGGAGKTVLARRLGELTGLPVTELDAHFWNPERGATPPGSWASRQRALLRSGSWILDGDLGPYDSALAERLRAADTVVVLDFALARCAWRALRRGRENAEFWRWVLAYRRRSLPPLLAAIAAHAPDAEIRVLRDPRAVRASLAEVPKKG